MLKQLMCIYVWIDGKRVKIEGGGGGSSSSRRLGADSQGPWLPANTRLNSKGLTPGRRGGGGGGAQRGIFLSKTGHFLCSQGATQA